MSPSSHVMKAVLEMDRIQSGNNYKIFSDSAGHWNETFRQSY